MSKFPQHGCPAWCTSTHSKSPVHLRNIDSVPRAGGHVEVEVNLIQDGRDAFVEIVLTDYALQKTFPDEMVSLIRFPIDLAGTWGHLATELDTRGALEVGQMLVVAVQLFREHRGCVHSWCVADHSLPDWAHAHESKAVRVGEAVLSLLLVDDERDEDYQGGMVRLTLPGGQHHEVSAGTALDTAAVMAAVAVGGEENELVQALRDHAATLGVRGVRYAAAPSRLRGRR